LFHEWYRSSYIDQVKQLPGWKRTSRFKLVFKKENKGEAGKAGKAKPITPTWLALHEFDAGSLDGGAAIDSLLVRDSGARELENTAKKIDVAAFEILRGFGDAESRWVDVVERTG
jgi:hypothetical protein